MNTEYQDIIDGITNSTEALKKVNDINRKSLEAIKTIGKNTDNKDHKKIISEITQGTQKILNMAKSKDMKGILAVQTELLQKYGS